MHNIHVTDKRKQIRKLDELPILDRSLIDYDKYKRFIGQAETKYAMAVQATRGCPYRCIYCDVVKTNELHFRRSADNIFDEVKMLADFGVKRIVFIDDIFNVHIKHCTEFFEKILKSGLKLHFFFPNGLKGDLFTKDLIDLFVEAGTVSMNLSLETASERLQKVIKKGLNIEKFRENLEYITETHPSVIISLNTMHGFPTETEEEAKMTLDFICSIKWIHFPYVHTVRTLPGTEMYKFAIAHGFSKKAIEQSSDYAYHETTPTLPFPVSFSRQYKMRFLAEYFFNKERLLSILPHQLRLLSEDELIQKYNSYLPTNINSLDHLLSFAGADRSDLQPFTPLDESRVNNSELMTLVRSKFPEKTTTENNLKLLLLDLSTYFSSEKHNVYDVLEPPHGLMSLLTYVNNYFDGEIKGKIGHSRIDFDSYKEMLNFVLEFNPDIIGIRTLTFYRVFFHDAIAYLRSNGITVPIVVGGPYPTGAHADVLKDTNIDLAVIAEGEVTLTELLRKTLENNHRLPETKELEDIPGVAFRREVSDAIAA